MKKFNNFHYQKSQEIIDDGILIVDNVNNMPTYHEPFISMNFVITVSHRGFVETEYDGNVKQFVPHDMALVYPGHVLLAHNISKDYNATSIVVSAELFEKLGVHKIYLSRFGYDINPDVHLTDSQYNDVIKTIDTMRVISRLDNDAKQEMMISMLYVLIQIIDTFRKENNKIDENLQTPLSTQLYETLNKHCREHRDVQYYAEFFHLSPKYFSTVIKKETGYNVGHWIRTYVIAHAKMLLRTNTDMSLQEVSERLGFPDIATFSRYFKRDTGISPSEYRKK